MSAIDSNKIKIEIAKLKNHFVESAIDTSTKQDILDCLCTLESNLLNSNKLRPIGVHSFYDKWSKDYILAIAVIGD